LTAIYRFFIIEIVKDNPKEKNINFGGIKGQAICQRYMDMTYDTMDKDGNVKMLPLFGDINIHTQRYTFSRPVGLLFATQFTQIALVVTERAAFEDMHSKGFVQKDLAFVGHSLGEYSALTSIADVLAISALTDIIFYRSITMRRAVGRDVHNYSNYAMYTVNSSHISKTCTESALCDVVNNIASQTGCLLEIVNFNIEVQFIFYIPSASYAQPLHIRINISTSHRSKHIKMFYLELLFSIGRVLSGINICTMYIGSNVVRHVVTSSPRLYTATRPAATLSLSVAQLSSAASPSTLLK
jgi:hypothetical protein